MFGSWIEAFSIEQAEGAGHGEQRIPNRWCIGVPGKGGGLRSATRRTIDEHSTRGTGGHLWESWRPLGGRNPPVRSRVSSLPIREWNRTTKKEQWNSSKYGGVVGDAIQKRQRLRVRGGGCVHRGCHGVHHLRVEPVLLNIGGKKSSGGMPSIIALPRGVRCFSGKTYEKGMAKIQN